MLRVNVVFECEQEQTKLFSAFEPSKVEEKNARFHFVHNFRMILAIGCTELLADDLLDDIGAPMKVRDIFYPEVLNQPIYYRRLFLYSESDWLSLTFLLPQIRTLRTYIALPMHSIAMKFTMRSYQMQTT